MRVMDLLMRSLHDTCKNDCKHSLPLKILGFVPLPHHCIGKAYEYKPKALLCSSTVDLNIMSILGSYFLVASFFNN